MTVYLGWKSAVFAAVLLLVAGVSIWLSVRSIRQRSITDWQREQRINQLSDKLDAARAEIARISAEADAIRAEQDGEAGKLAEALERLKELQSVPMPSPEQREAVCVACEMAVTLLESSLRLADLETLSLRRQVTVLEMALVDSEEMFSLQTKRLQAAQKDQKKVRRRNILSHVGVAAASLTIGVGLGRL